MFGGVTNQVASESTVLLTPSYYSASEEGLIGTHLFYRQRPCCRESHLEKWLCNINLAYTHNTIISRNSLRPCVVDIMVITGALIHKWSV